MRSLESDTTERLHFDFSLSCIGKGNGNPRQCSCLENPRDGGAWWAAIYGVAQSQTRLKRLSSSSSSSTVAHQAPLPFTISQRLRKLMCIDVIQSMDTWFASAAAKSLQLCPTLSDAINGSLPGSPVPGILQARTLEWVAISFSNA